MSKAPKPFAPRDPRDIGRALLFDDQQDVAARRQVQRATG